MLLIHSPIDPHACYSRYLAEILRLEGFMDAAEIDLEKVDATTLSAHDLVLLPRLTPTGRQAEALLDYLVQGGNLIAFLPAPNLVRRLGLQVLYRGVERGYLHLDPVEPINHGFVHDPLQIIVPVVAWSTEEASDARVLATVSPQHSSANGEHIPGVVELQVGAGKAILFAYDLPHAVARLRQGDPDHADLSFGGLDGIYRPSELFVNQLAVEQMRLPQVDLQTAWLARLVETLAPCLRLWYYPQAEQRSAMLMTSDDDWSTLDQFQVLIDGMKERDAHCSFYVVPQTHLTPAHMDRWEQAGHAFTVHPASEADIKSGLAQEEEQRHFVPAMLRENVARHQQEFRRTTRTIRQHAVRWFGYVEAARLLAELGVRMDLNYLSVHPFSLGYMAGSGRPLRFVETNGGLIDCFQQPTLWTEEVLIHPSFVFSFKWTVERALAETAQIIQDAARRFYTPVAINSHPVSFATYSSPLIEGCWDAALAEGMPILSADEWLDWTEARDAVRIEWDGEGGYILRSPHALPALTVIMPSAMTINEDGCTVSHQNLWGREYRAATFRNIQAGAKIRL